MLTVIPAQAGIQNLPCSRMQFLDPGLRRGDAISRKFNAVDCKEKSAALGWSSDNIFFLARVEISRTGEWRCSQPCTFC